MSESGDKRQPVDFANFGTPMPSFAQVRQLAAGSGMLRWAHHPHCSRHDHHLLRPFGRPVCLGCTCVAIGAPLGIVFACAMPWHAWTMWQWIALHLLLLAPTAVQPLLQKKAFKMFARILLGAVSGSYLISGLFKVDFFAPAWLFKLAVALAFAAVLKILLAWRNRRTSDPCSNCPQGMFPTCEWNLPRLLAANPHDSLLSQIRISDVTKPQNING
ncbi:hypothetical protein SAMN05443245_7642 [Paraburkholderia fungorum]|uniref:DUF2085 domain-containing protein n=1 Tax=Paraburkholderia fungorum TaxID=134537 RepID=A0A1H1JYZ3_9BURK|nr:hypothetical protein [Paraburkholderia fungorum]SDR55263.1 hypothetical protein SAMN05443245_7642 [Paraburkholderia fungorum]